MQTYMDADQQHRQPIMIHRAIFGSIERFFGILVENYAGAFPIWLAPVQAQILPVSPAVADYAEEAAATMRAKGLRVEVAGGEYPQPDTSSILAIQSQICSFQLRCNAYQKCLGY